MQTGSRDGHWILNTSACWIPIRPAYGRCKNPGSGWKKNQEKDNHDEVIFMIRIREDDHTIGFIGLDGIRWNHGDAYVGIGIGEREFRGKGYGTDTMRVLLNYAFTELNLHRVSLNVFAYNPMAIRSYEKAGFVIEGKQREYLNREGKRWDMVFMGILKEDWMKTRAT
jgi:RimJ/RimL family protein N-acetyltransferase